MPYQIVSSKPSPTNRTISFDFAGNVLRYVVGISYWKFRFSDDNHHVRKLELKVLSNHSGSRVTSSVTARMQDDSGHDVDDATSSIILTCIALVGSDSSNTVLTTVDAVGAPGASVAIPDSPHNIAMSFLEGWSLAYPSDDHHIEKVQLATGLQPNGNSGAVSSNAQMIDNSNNRAGGTIDAGVVAANSNERALLARLLPDLQSPTRVEYDFGKPLVYAGALIQSYLVEYADDDHHVRGIGGGTTQCTVEGSKVVLKDARAFIYDDTNHKQGDRISRVSMAVFAVPAP